MKPDRQWLAKVLEPGIKKVRGKIRTSEPTRLESFYLLGEQYTTAVVKPILGWARHSSLPLKGKSLIRFWQEIRGMKEHRNAFEGMGRYGKDHR